jgi:hypothetical protein
MTTAKQQFGKTANSHQTSPVGAGANGKPSRECPSSTGLMSIL